MRAGIDFWRRHSGQFRRMYRRPPHHHKSLRMRQAGQDNKGRSGTQAQPTALNRTKHPKRPENQQQKPHEAAEEQKKRIMAGVGMVKFYFLINGIHSLLIKFAFNCLTF